MKLSQLIFMFGISITIYLLFTKSVTINKTFSIFALFLLMIAVIFQQLGL